MNLTNWLNGFIINIVRNKIATLILIILRKSIPKNLNKDFLSECEENQP